MARMGRKAEATTLTTGRRSNLRRGFTLVELVLVMLILSVILALAVPVLRGFLLGRREANAVAQLLSLAQFARNEAVSAGNTCRLNLDGSARMYWLSVKEDTEFRDLKTEFGRRFELPDDFEARWAPGAGTTRTYADFFSDGHVESGTIELTSKSGARYELGCRSETEPFVVLKSESK